MLGRAFRGSQLQTQIYVNRRRRELSSAVLHALRGIDAHLESVHCVAPLEEKKFYEPRDGAFLALVGLPRFRAQLRAFWPARGPRWDALAVLQPGHAVLLIEGKSYPAEVLGYGCRASPHSRPTIVSSLNAARTWFGASDDADWLGPLYQYANRLAHVYFLRAICGREAFFVNLCFLDDPRTPTPREDWERELSAYKQQLGFGARIPYAVDLFLPARGRAELLAPRTRA